MARGTRTGWLQCFHQCTANDGVASFVGSAEELQDAWDESFAIRFKPRTPVQGHPVRSEGVNPAPGRVVPARGLGVAKKKKEVHAGHILALLEGLM